MKLLIDTTDKDDVKVNCYTLNPYELGMCIGKYLEIVAKDMATDCEELKLRVAQRFKDGIIDTEYAKVNSVKKVQDNE